MSDALRFTPENGESFAYNLCAVMVHEGASSQCGHYYDLIKDPTTDQWHQYNDKVSLPGFVMFFRS